jgi:hypothetical protein
MIIVLKKGYRGKYKKHVSGRSCVRSNTIQTQAQIASLKAFERTVIWFAKEKRVETGVRIVSLLHGGGEVI